jgi:hypothetical protein
MTGKRCRSPGDRASSFVSCRLVRLRLYQPDLDLFELDRATVLAAVLDRGQPGMHIWRGTLGRLHADLGLGALVPQHRQHVVKRRQPRRGNSCLPFCGGLVRNALGPASARTVSASQLNFPCIVGSTFQVATRVGPAQANIKQNMRRPGC